MTVTYNSKTYTCTKAIKGSNYVHLLDASGNLVASFEGVTSFTGFTLSGGSWSTPANITTASVAVVREDGVTCTCGVTLSKFHRSDVATQLTSGIHYGTTLPSSGVEGQLFFLLV